MYMKQTRFNSLQSNGPAFPAAYQPKGYKFAGIVLPVLAEEMLWKAARFLGSDYEKEAYSNGNMWACLKHELKGHPAQKMTGMLDFLSLLKEMKVEQEYLSGLKKGRAKEEKLAEKAEKDKLKEIYGFALLDGEPQPLGNFMIEAPNWILTRGKDPRKFAWKYAVEEKDVTLNIVNAKPPKEWKGQTKSEARSIWVMKYKIQCGHPSMKCAMTLNKTINFHGQVSVRQENIAGKFDKAANILKDWTRIQASIKAGVANGDEEAIILYLIQNTGIRIGGDKDLKTRAQTYGMSNLRQEHITPFVDRSGFNKVKFDFLGKDSVPETREILIDKDVWVALGKIWAGKSKGERVFSVEAGHVNAYLKKIMPGITVKNLRTVVCNEVLVKNLKQQKVTAKDSDADKLRAIFMANLEIAKTMNHQKGIGKNQKEGEQKIAERVQKAKDRVKVLKTSKSEKLEKLDTKAQKFQALYNNTPKLLKEKMGEIKAAKEKISAQIDKAIAAVEKTTLALDKKKLTANISLGTSLMNYADANVIVSYCKSIELPIEKLFSKSQLTGIGFALNVDSDYWRTYPS